MPDPLRLLRAQLAVSRALAASRTLEEAAPVLLRETCLSLGWDAGLFWRVEPRGRALSFVSMWSRPGVRLAAFEAESRLKRFTKGEGLPGRVWQLGKAIWIRNVHRDGNFPRAAAALDPGLQSAFGFPVRLGRAVYGVLEFFTRARRPPPRRLNPWLGGGGGCPPPRRPRTRRFSP
jgi:GAF domain-containing protein